jgi:YidC/Oxa1 family membrane protein insertase
MLALPFVFTVVVINFPTGLLVYWITTNVWTVGQQLAVKKFLPPPEPVAAGDGGGRAKGDSGGDDKPKGRWAGMLERAAQNAQTDGDKGADGKAGGAKGGGSKAAAKGGAKGSGGGGNGGPRKAPPPSPRKKKKRSGRRR